MKTTLALAVLLLCILAVASTQTAFAQTATVGVNAGNTFDYSYTLTWDSTDPAAIIPSGYAKLIDTQSIQLSIVSVEGTLINVDFTRHFKDGQKANKMVTLMLTLKSLKSPTLSY